MVARHLPIGARLRLIALSQPPAYGRSAQAARAASLLHAVTGSNRSAAHREADKPDAWAAKHTQAKGPPPARSSLISSSRNNRSLVKIERSLRSDDPSPAVLCEQRINGSVVRQVLSDYEQFGGGQRKRDCGDVGAVGWPPKEDRAVSSSEVLRLSHLPLAIVRARAWSA